MNYHTHHDLGDCKMKQSKFMFDEDTGLKSNVPNKKHSDKSKEVARLYLNKIKEALNG